MPSSEAVNWASLSSLDGEKPSSPTARPAEAGNGVVKRLPFESHRNVVPRLAYQILRRSLERRRKLVQGIGQAIRKPRARVKDRRKEG